MGSRSDPFIRREDLKKVVSKEIYIEGIGYRKVLEVPAIYPVIKEELWGEQKQRHLTGFEKVKITDESGKEKTEILLI